MLKTKILPAADNAVGTGLSALGAYLAVILVAAFVDRERPAATG